MEAKSVANLEGRLFASDFAERIIADLRWVARNYDREETGEDMIELFEAWLEGFNTELAELVYPAICLPWAAQVLSQSSENESLSP